MTLIDAKEWTGEDAEDRRENLARSRAKAERWRQFATEEGVYDAFDEMETALLKGLANSRPRDEKGREKIYQQVRALKNMRGIFERVIGGGKAAARELNKMENGNRSFF